MNREELEVTKETGREIKESDSGRETEIDLLELFYYLLERAKYIVVAALIGALVMGVYSYKIARPEYKATSIIYVVNRQDTAINLSDLQIGSYLTRDYQQIFDAWEVQEMVLQNLGLDYSYGQLRSMISLENPENTRMINIVATSCDPHEAAALANEFASVASTYISETMHTEQPSLVSQALVPTAPVSPNKARNVALGALLGALLVGGVLTLCFILDDKVRGADDLRKHMGMTVLAVVPVNGAARKGAAMPKKQTRGPARRKEGGR